MISATDNNLFSNAFPGPSLEAVVDWIQDRLEPGDVFDENVLRDGALNNGFVEEE